MILLCCSVLTYSVITCIAFYYRAHSESNCVSIVVLFSTVQTSVRRLQKPQKSVLGILNPYSFPALHVLLAQWIRHRSTEPGILGSTPRQDFIFLLASFKGMHCERYMRPPFCFTITSTQAVSWISTCSSCDRQAERSERKRMACSSSTENITWKYNYDKCDAIRCLQDLVALPWQNKGWGTKAAMKVMTTVK